jgi:hypothetical protein
MDFNYSIKHFDCRPPIPALPAMRRQDAPLADDPPAL